MYQRTAVEYPSHIKLTDRLRMWDAAANQSATVLL